MARFNIGDIICKDEISVPYTVTDIDEISGPVIKYELTQGNFIFWDYCIGWKKFLTADDALRYGEVLTDDNFTYDILSGKGYDEVEFTRIRTIRYEYRIFYHKMVNGEVVEFKELTV